MSVYFVTGKGWRYNFILRGVRYNSACFRTKREAKQAEPRKREEVINPPKTPIDMDFLELVNKQLDYLKAYTTVKHYKNNLYAAKRWTKQWGKLNCGGISTEMVQEHLFKRRKISASSANYDLKHLRALFNFGMKKKWISVNPTQGISFFPTERNVKYVPPKEDVLKVILVADPDTQGYLYTIKETMGRMSEINRLTWTDMDLEERYVILYTRKKKGGHLTPRKVPMTNKLYEILSRRYKQRDKEKPWVFWHRYWSRKEGKFVEAPYQERKGLMRSLCKKAGVKYFRYHAFRHLGASILDNAKVGIGAIQRILGHESRTTTEIYLHSIGEAEREAMRIFEKASKKSRTKSRIGRSEKTGSQLYPH